ncbi:hypothetical protein CGRA01v4_06361 [Colletotrichum graminicola]|nr:hypothetical protein CGRA01v4_06361 [Colletotrichum graminicola]
MSTSSLSVYAAAPYDDSWRADMAGCLSLRHVSAPRNMAGHAGRQQGGTPKSQGGEGECLKLKPAAIHVLA